LQEIKIFLKKVQKNFGGLKKGCIFALSKGWNN